MKMPRKKTLLYGFLGLTVCLGVALFCGFQYVKYQFFRETPNSLTWESDLHPVPFQWSKTEYDGYTEPHDAMLVPVAIPGIAAKLFMQFDTGSPYTFVRSGAVQSLRSQGLELETFVEDDQTYLRHLSLEIGGNQLSMNSGRVRPRSATINWENPDAINIIGTLGSDFLDQHICEIDFPAREIRLHASRTERLNLLGEFTAFSFRGRRIMLPTEIDGVEQVLFYDSGCSAFGLFTSKYHFAQHADMDAEGISYNANRHGDPLPVKHRPTEVVAKLGDVQLPLKRVSYVDMYSGLQSALGRFVHGGVLGNKSLTECTLIIDAKAEEFLVVEGSLQVPRVTEARQAKLEIPFTLTEANNIKIEVTLNDKHPLSLMFHTGNSQVCLTTAATKLLTDLSLDGQADVQSWGGASETRYSTGNRLQIGSRQWQDVAIFEDTHSGPGTDGKFGPDLFEGQSVELDFDRQVMVIRDSLPEKAASFRRLDCRQDRGSLFVRGQLDVGSKSLENEFMIHTGFGGTVLLDDKFVLDNDLNQMEAISQSELRDSFGNVLKTVKVILPKLTLGKSSFCNIPIGFFDGAIGRQEMSVIGGEVWKRFHIILGPKRAAVYLKPNRLFELEFRA